MSSEADSWALPFLPFHVPLIEDDDVQAVVQALKSGWLTTGPRAKEFEQKFARAVHAKHAVAVNSGTAALHLALDAIGIGAGDEVILPTLTFAATGEVVIYRNARPVLVDSVGADWNIDPVALERAITPRTKAVIPVHFGGQPCDMDSILAIARIHNLSVIEDAAHAFPAVYRGQPIGSIGDVTCFSFYATKTLTMGEGGLAATQSPELAELMRSKSLHGISKDAWKRYAPGAAWEYDILAAGYKYNLTDIAASLGLAQLSKANRMWQRRRDIAGLYSRQLKGIEAFELPTQKAGVTGSWHLYVILINDKFLSIDRNRVIQVLKTAGIGTSVHFKPLHLHSYYQGVWGHVRGDFPVAEDYFGRCVSLPIYPGMTDADVARVSDALRDLSKRFARSSTAQGSEATKAASVV